jgi:DNA polymerase (family 10)
MARDMGVKIAISTDAHSAEGLDMMRFGIDQARRGWLKATEVINTLPWSRLQSVLHR